MAADREDGGGGTSSRRLRSFVYGTVARAGRAGRVVTQAAREQFTAKQPEVTRLRAPHCGQQSKACDIGVALSGHELDPAVQ